MRRYCLNAYRVTSGNHPVVMQHLLCEICGGPHDEMDHRLATEMAKELGPAAMLRAFTQDRRLACALRPMC